MFLVLNVVDTVEQGNSKGTAKPMLFSMLVNMDHLQRLIPGDDGCLLIFGNSQRLICRNAAADIIKALGAARIEAIPQKPEPEPEEIPVLETVPPDRPRRGRPRKEK